MRTALGSAGRMVIALLALGAPASLSSCSLVRPLEYLSRETSNPVDAGPDGATATDAPAADASDATAKPPFCKTPPASDALFCADFDQGVLGAYNGGESTSLGEPNVASGASWALDTNEAYSRPGALMLATPAVSESSSTYAYLDDPIESGPAKHVRLSFQLFVSELTSGETIDIVTLVLPSADGGAPVRAFYTLGASQDRLSIEGTEPTAEVTMPPLARKKWTRVAIEIALGQRIEARLSLREDPPKIVSNVPPFSISKSSYFLLGPAVLGPAGAVRVSIDDVVYEASAD